MNKDMDIVWPSLAHQYKPRGPQRSGGPKTATTRQPQSPRWPVNAPHTVVPAGSSPQAAACLLQGSAVNMNACGNYMTAARASGAPSACTARLRQYRVSVVKFLSAGADAAAGWGNRSRARATACARCQGRTTVRARAGRRQDGDGASMAFDVCVRAAGGGR